MNDSLSSWVRMVLPYLFGGAILYFIYRKVFFRDYLEKIKKKSSIAEVEYIGMSDVERKRYAKKISDLILDLLKFRFFSSWRDCSDVVELVTGNSFCIVDVGREFDEHWMFSPLSRYLTHSLGAEEIISISDELVLLRESGY